MRFLKPSALVKGSTCRDEAQEVCYNWKDHHGGREKETAENAHPYLRI